MSGFLFHIESAGFWSGGTGEVQIDLDGYRYARPVRRDGNNHFRTSVKRASKRHREMAVGGELSRGLMGPNGLDSLRLRRIAVQFPNDEGVHFRFGHAAHSTTTRAA